MTQPSCHQYAAEAGQGLATLQRHTPTGMAWDAYRIEGKRAYRLWSAIGRLFDDMTAKLCDLARELNPFSTEHLLPEWERAVSLPDPCLPQADTLDERRAWVVWRLTKRRWTTAQDWQELAGLFGLSIRVTPGWLVQRPALFDQCFDYIFWDFPKLGRFRVYVDILNGCSDGGGFDYDLDYAFESDNPRCAAFKCLIERVAPANVVIVWNADPVGNGWTNCGA